MKLLTVFKLRIEGVICSLCTRKKMKEIIMKTAGTEPSICFTSWTSKCTVLPIYDVINGQMLSKHESKLTMSVGVVVAKLNTFGPLVPEILATSGL